ncbi:hypothetical protein SAMN02745975_00044 [Geosporobacter subterraneus DSM 17957]|uniref:Regulatory protein, luxR family n=1 Tax=Geosporobacter subterraneus DSM 17957 TaxID=1121919 RepID=A0A1M6BSS8_9FIRM|nr:hypothetical protein [Geosporobacter subterraneus]SHI51770.1 hypothetical protein SAMN02745975_00044 [Geosporobacter subterraneus DSM 17957]
MEKKIGYYLGRKNMSQFTDIDFHDFIDMVQSGLGDEEIAKELGISGNYVRKLKDEITIRY